jgi:uncharacterized protein
MAQLDIADVDTSAMPPEMAGDVYFQLGMMYASGRSVRSNLITAHKCFNLAAAKGNSAAVRYRGDLAREMTAAEVAEAQRQAREWLTN